MKRTGKVAIVVVVVAAVVAVAALKNPKTSSEQSRGIEPAAVTAATKHASPAVPTDEVAAVRTPTLLDLGSKTCIPCKMMAPILKELAEEYKGRLEVAFIDVRTDAVAAQLYGIEVIPTQIFIDSHGTELDRHVGFMSKEDILARWNELGFDLSVDEAAGG